MKVLNRKEISIFLLTLGIHLFFLCIAFGVYHTQNTGADVKYIYDRFTAAGDAPHYLYLAEHGYQSEGEQAKLIVFYPLYPLLIKILGTLLLGNYELAGLTISYICSGLASIFLFKLVEIDYGEARAVESVLLFLMYPFMMFTMGVYTESLFLLLILAGLYQIRKRAWVNVGVLGFLAALCRMQGMLLLAPAVYEYLQIKAQSGKKWKEYMDKKHILILIMPVGFLCYLLLNQIVAGKWNAFWEYQQAPPWYQSTHWINTNLIKDYGMALEHRSLSFIIYWVQIVMFFVAAVALFFGIKKKVRTSVIVYGGIYTCFCYLTGWLISGGRYMMGCVSLFVIYAAIEKEWVRHLILGMSGTLCMIYMILYMQGQAIM